MNICINCIHAGVCVVRAQLEKGTILTFPDGQVAVVDMENALRSCDHHTPVGQQAPISPTPVNPLPADPFPADEQGFTGTDPDSGIHLRRTAPPESPRGGPPPRWVPPGSGGQPGLATGGGSPAFFIPNEDGSQPAVSMGQQSHRPIVRPAGAAPAAARRIPLTNLPPSS